jgi:flagellar biosynthesis protein FlhF
VEIIAAVDYEEALHDAAGLATETGPGTATAEDQVVAAQDEEPSVKIAGESATAPLQETAMQEMQQEIRSLRSMLEVPLSQLAWAEMGRRQPFRAALLKRLTTLGLHAVVANRIADQLAEINDEPQAWQQALAALEGMIPVEDDDLLTKGGVVALLGPTGVGKTTTIAKLAARFALRHGRRHVALVTMDHYRIGAHDQLRTYGRLLGVPVYIAGDREELEVILNQMNDRRLILIDTAGASQRDVRLAEQFSMLDVDNATVKRYLVLSATGEMSVHDEVVRSFSGIHPDRCILTKLDEATSLGGVLSVLMKYRLPVAYLGDGQRVPDDFHCARARRLVAQAAALLKDTEEVQSDEVWVQAMGTTEAGTHAHAHG